MNKEAAPLEARLKAAFPGLDEKNTSVVLHYLQEKTKDAYAGDDAAAFAAKVNKLIPAAFSDYMHKSLVMLGSLLTTLAFIVLAVVFVVVRMVVYRRNRDLLPDPESVNSYFV